MDVYLRISFLRAWSHLLSMYYWELSCFRLPCTFLFIYAVGTHNCDVIV